MAMQLAGNFAEAKPLAHKKVDATAFFQGKLTISQREYTPALRVFADLNCWTLTLALSSPPPVALRLAIRLKTSTASLTAGAVMLFVFSSGLVREYLIPDAYSKLYLAIEIPVILVVVMGISEYGRRLAKKRGENFPL